MRVHITVLGRNDKLLLLGVIVKMASDVNAVRIILACTISFYNLMRPDVPYNNILCSIIMSLVVL